MATEERITYCRICEPLCGLVATVQDGELVKLRPDREHPLSRGFACPKGIAMTEVQNDPDRVTHPLRRLPDGGFERVSAGTRRSATSRARLRSVLEHHGGGSRRLVLRQPLGVLVLASDLGQGVHGRDRLAHLYSAGSQDVNNRFVASALLYGSPVVVPIPDLDRTDLLLIVGANPLVSHGSVLTRAADQGRAARDRRPRRSRGRRRPAALGDRPRVRARADQARCRRVAAAVDAAGDLRRGARGRAAPSPRSRAASTRCGRWSSRASRPRRPSRARESPPACGRVAGPRPRDAPVMPPYTDAPARASVATARSSRSCSTR